MSLQLYKSHLKNMVLKDIQILKKRKQKLCEMKSNLESDGQKEKLLEKSIKELKKENIKEPNIELKQEVSYLKQ